MDKPTSGSHARIWNILFVVSGLLALNLNNSFPRVPEKRWRQPKDYSDRKEFLFAGNKAA
jgi:hypothetical protein